MHLLQGRDQRGQVAQVTFDQLQGRVLVQHQLGLGVVLTPNQPEDLVTLAGQELRHVPAVLAGDSRDESSTHRLRLLAGWLADPIPVRLQLVQELGATLRLVGFMQRGGASTQTVQAAEKSPILGVRPPDVPRPSPTGTT